VPVSERSGEDLEDEQPDVAQQRLQYLVDTFPQSEESALARERLAALRPR